jgi:hypothetical protein
MQKGHNPIRLNWDASTLEHLEYFRALPLAEKIAMVEDMCDTVAYFREKAALRQIRKIGHPSSPRLRRAGRGTEAQGEE